MSTLLDLGGLCAWYGASQVLYGVDLRIDAGEIVALAGRNGSGRSTLAKAVMGMVRAQGRRYFAGHDLDGLRTFEIARLGLGYVAEQRDVFTALSVHENLLLGDITQTQPRTQRRSSRFTPDDAYALFPGLYARRSVRAEALSGGEQQMLALARALVGDPALLIVDEPAEGLAVPMVARVGECLKALRARGIAVLLIEQRLVLARELADRVAVMGRGALVFDGSLQQLVQAGDVVNGWLGVG